MENTLAAQYLRVSTERQEYSISFQSAGIATYAQEHNFTVCETYIDEAKSGLEIKHRKGLSQLLHDVLAGKHLYKAILVYDVSRWGRFQDPDEAAAYEFLCKTAGVRVHYCAEHFHNDGYLPNVILKALKRVMAGEYSRELSEKVFAGESRVARDGFRAGGHAGYGLRRVLISATKIQKGVLGPGERKSLSNERVKLIPGPANETHWVREIYRMFISENRTMQGIADELNRLRVPFLEGRKWTRMGVRGILTNPKYKGTTLYNFTKSRLRSQVRTNPETEWIVVPNSFEAIVEPETFEAAQQALRNMPYYWSDDQVLEALRSILRAKGKISLTLFRGTPHALSKEGYRRRFGSLVRAYDLAGYDSPLKATVAHRGEIRKLRQGLMETLVRLFPGKVSIHTRGPIRRNCLRLKNGTRVAVRACRRRKNNHKGPTWILQRARNEERMISLLVCVNADNATPDHIYVLPPIANRSAVVLSLDHSWLKKGIRLEELSSFCDAVQQISRQDRRPIGGERRPKGWISDDARAAMSEALRFRWRLKKNLSR
jgi:DNA invertase Pin-like site-specific DNA recombinase